MSPGGLLSAGTGDSEGSGLWEPEPEPAVDELAGVVVPPAGDEGVVVAFELHATDAAARTPRARNPAMSRGFVISLLFDIRSVAAFHPCRGERARPPYVYPLLHEKTVREPGNAPISHGLLMIERPPLCVRSAMRILLVEDETKMARALRRGLEQEGYAVDVLGDGEEALYQATENEYDAVVLDVMLPRLDGFQVCESLRERGRWAPVLMLTARDAVGDRIRGLDVGADDYLVKPFAFGELLARLRALIRRGPFERPAVVEVEDLVLDPAAHRVTRDGKEVELSSREFALLEYLMRHPGQVLTRRQIQEHVWDYNYEGLSNVVDVYVGYLRKKLERPFGRPLIRTVRGVGYAIGE
jgi:two-component system OmpR family response regulator